MEISMHAEDFAAGQEKKLQDAGRTGNYSNKLVPAYMFRIISVDRHIAGRAVMHGVSRWQEDIPSQEPV